MVLALAGMGGFVVFLVMLIVAAFKKKPIKIQLIGAAICFVLFAVGTAMAPPDPAVVDSLGAAQEQEVTPSAQPVRPAVPEPEPSNLEPDQEALTQEPAQAYVRKATEHSLTLSRALSELGRLLANPQLGMEAWNSQVAVQMALVQQTHQELFATDPPPEMKEVHIQILAATSDLDEAMNLLSSGISNLNAPSIERASELMISGSTKLSKATIMLEAAER